MSINDCWLARQLLTAQIVATLLHLLPTDLFNIIVMQLIIAYYLMNNRSTCKSKLHRKKFYVPPWWSSHPSSKVLKFSNLYFEEDSFVPFQVFSTRISFEMKRFRALLLPTLMGAEIRLFRQPLYPETCHYFCTAQIKMLY